MDVYIRNKTIALHISPWDPSLTAICDMYQMSVTEIKTDDSYVWNLVLLLGFQGAILAAVIMFSLTENNTSLSGLTSAAAACIGGVIQ